MSNVDKKVVLEPIGYIETPFDEKFAVPRQSVLIKHGKFVIHFYEPYNQASAFVGIDDFSHIWVTFIFNKIEEHRSFSARVRPPRLGGNIYKGVFASRSPFRPNRLGLSVLKIKSVINDNEKISIEVEGADIVNGTPIFDIKPYIEFTDSIPNAISGYAANTPSLVDVNFSEQALLDLERISIDEFKELIVDVLSQDPRPAYKQIRDDKGREYGVKLYGHNVKWIMKDNSVFVTTIG
ncbi:MAG: tRNA (N6-threonylcarbamoyladenosine(37)-N6)-methyltransferase TrmO [Succinivibrionaceae bacterium]